MENKPQRKPKVDAGVHPYKARIPIPIWEKIQQEPESANKVIIRALEKYFDIPHTNWMTGRRE
jgi:hypothetical protein